MAEPEDIKKIFIYPDQLLPVTTNYIRFRIVSEDGVQASHWSQVYILDDTTS